MIFSAIINKLKEVLNRMFSKGTLESKINMDIAMSTEMQNHIDLCKKVHENKAPWVNNKTVFSSNTGQGIASEFARLVTIEFKSEISNNDFLNGEYQVVVDNIRNYTQFACAEGGLVFKPYVSNGHIEVDMVRADAFFPITFNSRGDVKAALFMETKVVGKTTYTRLEIHNLEIRKEAGKDVPYCVITNLAFKKDNYSQFNSSNDNQLGEEILLTEVQEWENIQKVTPIKDVDKPLFAYFKMPLANTIDSTSPLGVSVCTPIVDDNGVGLLGQIDRQYSKILWEYEAKEAAIDIDRGMLTKDNQGNPIMPVGKERLYRNLNIDALSTKTSQWNIYSPEIRDSSLFNGLNKLLKRAEFLVGLAYGTLSDVEETAKTATEIKMSKQRSAQTVSDIQKAQKKALKDLGYAMSVLGVLYQLPVKPIDTEKDMTFTYGDSIVTDTDSDNNSMYLDVSGGLLKPIYYIMKKYKVSEAEAKDMMADTQDSINDNPLDQNLDSNTNLPK